MVTGERRLTPGQQAAIIALVVLVFFAFTGLLGFIVEFLVAYITLILFLIAAAISLMFILLALSTALFIFSALIWTPVWVVSGIWNYSRRRYEAENRRREANQASQRREEDDDTPRDPDYVYI